MRTPPQVLFRKTFHVIFSHFNRNKQLSWYRTENIDLQNRKISSPRLPREFCKKSFSPPPQQISAYASDWIYGHWFTQKSIPWYACYLSGFHACCLHAICSMLAMDLLGRR